MGNITLIESIFNETFCCCLCKPEENNHKYIPIFPSKVNFSDYIIYIPQTSSKFNNIKTIKLFNLNKVVAVNSSTAFFQTKLLYTTTKYKHK